jgi:hypothetical protein
LDIIYGNLKALPNQVVRVSRKISVNYYENKNNITNTLKNQGSPGY